MQETWSGWYRAGDGHRWQKMLTAPTFDEAWDKLLGLNVHGDRLVTREDPNEPARKTQRKSGKSAKSVNR